MKVVSNAVRGISQRNESIMMAVQFYDGKVGFCLVRKKHWLLHVWTIYGQWAIEHRRRGTIGNISYVVFSVGGVRWRHESVSALVWYEVMKLMWE